MIATAPNAASMLQLLMADMPTPNAMRQSFTLSNAVPQNRNQNSGSWLKIEKDTRAYVMRAVSDVYVITAPVFEEDGKTIGANQVRVPTHLFKLVYDQASGRSWAYILDNTATAIINPPMDYAQFVKTTGWQLLPQ